MTADPSAPRVLVVEGEPEMAGILTYTLEDEGFLVTVACNGIQALHRLEAEPVDLIVLDHVPPGVDGFEVCRRIRARTTTPVLMLTALKEPEHVVRSLELGADDYMTKPFNHGELVLRIKSILKRTGLGQTSRPLKVGEIAINPSQRRVTVRGREINVTPTEFKLLTYLAQHVGWVLAWQAILKAVWGAQDLEGGQDLIKVTVGRLRTKIEPAPEQPTYIQSVRGIGYRFAPPEPG